MRLGWPRLKRRSIISTRFFSQVMGQRHKLLIVDDEISNLQKLRRTFLQDFQIFKAQTGDAALDLLGSECFDVIITDQKMPGISGVELLGRSLAYCPDSIRIILTGYTEVDYLMDAINEGRVHRYITKPWEPFALRQTVLQDLEHHHLKKAHQLVEEQLRIAREVQTHLFPQSFPRFSDLTYAGTCRTAGQIGGDFYDFLKLSDEEFCVAVGDVSGKGISAALLMASLQALLRSHISHRRETLPLMLRDINRLLRSFTDGSRFATLFCGVYRGGENQLTYVNAGHNPPLVVCSGEAAQRLVPLPATGVPLGLFGSSEYSEATVGLQPGDTLVAYTDGVPEAENPLGEQFGEERLREALLAAAGLPPDQLQASLLEQVRSFCAGRPLADDLTIVVLKAGEKRGLVSASEVIEEFGVS